MMKTFAKSAGLAIVALGIASGGAAIAGETASRTLAVSSVDEGAVTTLEQAQTPPKKKKKTSSGTGSGSDQRGS